MTLTMTVSATEPISGTFPIELDGPGLHLLEGPPEAGKSNILDSLLFAYLKATGGDPKRDRYRVNVSFQAQVNARNIGAEAVGQITLPGLKGQPSGVKIHESTVRRLPAPPAVQILDGTPFKDLTRNGLTDPKNRQSAELKAFAAITQVRATPKDLVPEDMTDEVAHLANEAELLPEVADKVRRTLHALKGRWLDDAAATERKLNVCRDQADVEADKADVGTEVQERQSLAQAEKDATEIRIARATRVQKEQNREQLLAVHSSRPSTGDLVARLEAAKSELDSHIDAAADGLPPEPDIDTATVGVISAERHLRHANEATDEAQARIIELEQQLAVARVQLQMRKESQERANEAVDKAKQALVAVETTHNAWMAQKASYDARKATVAAAQRTVDDLATQLRQAEKRAHEWDARQALIDAPIVGPDQDEVTAAMAKVDEFRARAELGKRKDAEGARKIEEAMLAAKHAGQLETAARYEHAAIDGLKAKISQILTARRIDGWAIEDGVLMCHSPRQGMLVPFSDLSRSTQDMAALKLMLQQMPVEPSAEFHLVLVPQEGFDGTTESQRVELSRIARDAGRYLLSARVVESGDLKVVRVG